MFQRQSRAPFPVQNIVLLAAIVGACVFFILKYQRKPEATIPAPESVAIDSIDAPAQR